MSINDLGLHREPIHRNRTTILTMRLALLCLGTALGCQNIDDCSANGVCGPDHRCACIAAFAGEACERFAFEPVRRSLGEGLMQQDPITGLRTSTWGGSVLHHDGALHMWASEMVDGAGIKSWISNSQIVHAVASSPEAPFRFERKAPVWPVFAHEPTVSRAPSGEFVMFFSSSMLEGRGIPCTGVSCRGENGTSAPSCRNDQQCNVSMPLPTLMAYSPPGKPEGPWSHPTPVPSPTRGDTNMACHISDDGSMLCLGRPGLGRLSARDWRNVSTYTSWSQPKGALRGEDPFVWRDPSGVYHAVLHGGGWDKPFGYHYCACFFTAPRTPISLACPGAHTCTARRRCSDQICRVLGAPLTF